MCVCLAWRQRRWEVTLSKRGWEPAPGIFQSPSVSANPQIHRAWPASPWCWCPRLSRALSHSPRGEKPICPLQESPGKAEGGVYKWGLVFVQSVYSRAGCTLRLTTACPTPESWNLVTHPLWSWDRVWAWAGKASKRAFHRILFCHTCRLVSHLAFWEPNGGVQFSSAQLKLFPDWSIAEELVTGLSWLPKHSPEMRLACFPCCLIVGNWKMTFLLLQREMLCRNLRMEEGFQCAFSVRS